jgi:hypothetical protein
VQTLPGSRRAASIGARRGPHSRRRRFATPPRLSLCLLAACALLVSSAAASGISAPAKGALPGAAVVHRQQLRPPPAPTRTMARRQSTRRANAERLIATPSTLPAAGGTVRLRARVRRAAICRFSSAGALKALPSTKSCRSGLASVTVKVPRNRSSSPRRYTLYLTVGKLHGARHTVREVIVVRRRPGSGGSTLSGVTAASGVNGQAASLTAVGAPVITSEPTDQSVAAGAPVTFSAAASGTPAPNAQWQVSADAGATWAQTSPSFAASAAENGDEYRAVFTNSLGTATTAVVTLSVAPESTTNFSGYISFASPGQSFSAVSASWTVPTVTCQPGETSWAAQWPGIGDGSSVAQDGTETDCFNGVPNYWAWYEMYGDQAVNGGYAVPLSGSTYPVQPGDVMTGSVSLSGTTWLLTIADATQNWSSETQIAQPTPGMSQGSAEWMVEDPNGCSPQCDVLAQYSPVTFSHATATGGGLTGPISSFPVTVMEIDQNSTLLATSGQLNATGDGFTDTWLAG